MVGFSAKSDEETGINGYVIDIGQQFEHKFTTKNLIYSHRVFHNVETLDNMK